MATKNKQPQLLKRYMRAERLTQNELARLLEVSPAHISRVLRGERELGKDKVFKAAQIIGVPMESFFQ